MRVSVMYGLPAHPVEAELLALSQREAPHTRLVRFADGVEFFCSLHELTPLDEEAEVELAAARLRAGEEVP